MTDIDAYNDSQLAKHEQRFLEHEPDKLNETENINEIIKNQHCKFQRDIETRL